MGAAPAQLSPNATEVTVFFATDRNPLPPTGDSALFGSLRSEAGALHLGECRISIPKIHRTGRLERPSIFRLEVREDPEKHIILNHTLSLDEQAFLDRVRARIALSPSRDAFLFVHGYNVSFASAARRTGQMAFDLHFAGAPIFYSWPSQGHGDDYLKDETNIAWSTPHFQRFLTLLAHQTGVQRLHLIAHSMGNRAVCDALRSLTLDPNTSLHLTHLVLAAPDIDAATFAELAATLGRLSTRITLYQSSNDKALQVSRQLHGNPRAGEPILVLPGLDTIDASAIDTDFLGHSYFSDNWPLLSDIFNLLSTDAAPASRFGLSAQTHASGTYYAFRP